MRFRPRACEVDGKWRARRRHDWLQGTRPHDSGTGLRHGDNPGGQQHGQSGCEPDLNDLPETKHSPPARSLPAPFSAMEIHLRLLRRGLYFTASGTVNAKGLGDWTHGAACAARSHSHCILRASITTKRVLACQHQPCLGLNVVRSLQRYDQKDLRTIDVTLTEPRFDGAALALPTPSKKSRYRDSAFIAATSSLTATTLFWKSARSSGVNSSSMMRSTPPAPRMTGTPT